LRVEVPANERILFKSGLRPVKSRTYRPNPAWGNQSSLRCKARQRRKEE
jgi:hypothetical protein